MAGQTPRSRGRENETASFAGRQWALNLAAATQYHQREGHLRVPRKHIETIVVDVDCEGQEERELKLGAWINNQRCRAATLSPERVEQLSVIGMRWS